jgi:hemerythrin-like domain-containing protein
MADAPRLLNDDGSASMATALLMSHHGFRRDIARFAIALRRLAEDQSRVPALQGEWKTYHETLHHHHEAEDQGMFPSMRAEHPELAAVIDRLSADHRRIDPLLAKGDAAFTNLGTAPEVAAEVVAELARLLDEHLALEEANVIRLIREARTFPPPESEEMIKLYAEGFAWASYGVAPEVLARVDEMLPKAVTDRLAPARAAFEERAMRVWGPTPAGASRTAIPDWLGG